NMKFAKQLALRTIQSWSDYYLDYKLLKKYIKEASAIYYGRKLITWPIYCLLFALFRGFLILNCDQKNKNKKANNRNPDILKKTVVEFRELLIIELKKVDARFEQVETESSDTLDELSTRV